MNIRCHVVAWRQFYWTIGMISPNGSHWVDRVGDALRFADREQAEAVASMIRNDGGGTECRVEEYHFATTQRQSTGQEDNHGT